MAEKRVEKSEYSSFAKLLADRNVHYDEIKGVEKLDPKEIAEIRKMSISQALKCIIGKDGRGNPHVILVPEGSKVRFNHVSREANTKVQQLTSAELEREGIAQGPVSPLQFLDKQGARFYMDVSLFNNREVVISSGDPHCGFVVNTHELARALNAKPCSIAKPRGGAHLRRE